MRLFSTIAIVLFLAVGISPTQANAGYEAFFGVYEGRTEPMGVAGVEKRDLSVEIKEADKGFTVKWTTIIERPDGKIKKRTATMEFRPSKRDYLYYAAGRKDMFGNIVPIDPLRGDPYFWARIVEKTLIVNGLLIRDDGGYEMQSYSRTLVDNGLELKFTRIRDGEHLKEIDATLTKVK